MSSTDEAAEDTQSVPDRLLAGFRGAGARIRVLLPGFVRRSYLLKFMLALLVVVAAIAGVGVSAWAATTETLDDQISEQLRADAEREAQNIGEWREQRQVWINDLSRVHVGRGLDDDLEMNTRLQANADTYPGDARSVHMIDLESTEVVASSGASQRGTRLSETGTPWAQEDVTALLEGRNDVFVSDVYTDSGRQVIAFVTEIPQTRNAALVGVVQSQDFIAEVPPESGRFTTVVDTTTGEVVMANRLVDGEQVGAELVGTTYGDDSTRTLLTRNNASYLGTAPNQAALEQSYVAAKAAVPNTDYVVVSHAPEEQVFAVRDNIVSQLVLLVFVSLVGLTLIGIVIAGGTVRSLQRLTEKANELEKGNLDIELSTSREDEIGRLYDGFDNMRLSLQDRIQIISVLNRLLRHNLRNSLTSILLHTEQLSDGVTEDEDEHVDRIVNVAERLMRHVEKSQAIERIIDTHTDELGVVDLVAVIEDSLDVYQNEYPDASLSVTLPERARVRGGDAVPFVVDNLVENALEHHDQTEPQVWVTVEMVAEGGDRQAEIRIEDDGPGIPDIETEVLEQQEETALEHGSGIGLWLVNWLVEHMNGTVSFEDREPRGTRVTVQVPAVEDEHQPLPAETTTR